MEQHFSEIAKAKSTFELYNGLKDIKETLKLWGQATTPYTQKLWAEFDAYIVEYEKRTRNFKNWKQGLTNN